MFGIRLLSLAQVTMLIAACSMHAAINPNLGEVSQLMFLVAEKDNGRSVDIRVGESVQINLPENATTGYRWIIDRYDEEFVEAIATEPRYTAKAIGSGGEVAFIFKGKKIGAGEIILKYWRHWEGDSSITSRFRIRLNVLP